MSRLLKPAYPKMMVIPFTITEGWSGSNPLGRWRSKTAVRR